MKCLQQFAAVFGLALLTLLLSTGCQSTSSQSNVPVNDEKLQELIQAQANGGKIKADFTIREGDVLNIIFAGAPDLNSRQTVRRDGKIEMPLVGEVQAAGLTPAELEQAILKRYGNQLVSKEVTVTVQSALYDVFVTGAVIKPGKVSADRPITALEAIMEAGGPDYTKANLKDVTVVRQENGRSKNYRLNLREVLDGKRTETFYLKPSDIIYVREKFNWF
jgi:polysaccharide export outer membrane protein